MIRRLRPVKGSVAAAAWCMARRICTERQQQLDQALATIRAEKVLLMRQRARVAAARQAVLRLSSCDYCGARVLPSGCELKLCTPCAAQQREQQRAELLELHGTTPRAASPEFRVPQRPGLLADEVAGDPAAVGYCPVLPQVNPLPYP